jgi:uncharacterized protein YbcV (DUF1398 family)
MHMNATTLQQLATATLTGTMPFAEIVGRLIQEGVDHYQVDYLLMQFRFYGVHGGVVQVPLVFEDLPSVHTPFDVTALQAALHDSQANGQKYRDFCRRAMLAGVQSYSVFLSGQRVMYVGRQGEHHVEWFPGAAPVDAHH